MSYRCKTCNKELEDYILVCDNCGTKKPSIKIQETKKEVTEEEKKERMLNMVLHTSNQLSITQ